MPITLTPVNDPGIAPGTQLLPEGYSVDPNTVSYLSINGTVYKTLSGRPGMVKPIGATEIPFAGGALDISNYGTTPQTQTQQNLTVGVDNQPGQVAPVSTSDVASFNPNAAVSNPPAPSINPISNPVVAPSSTSTPPPITLPTPTAGNTAVTYTTGLNSQVDSLKQQIQAQADAQAKTYQDQIDALKVRETELQQLQDAGMLDLKNTVMQETEEKKAQLELERQRFDENYNANQALIGELGDLLSEGNAIIEGLQNTTGLASIMNPRIADTMSKVQARAGVIQAVISARNGQMAQAQNQLASATAAISSIYNDQINYYKTVVDYYSNLKSENNTKILNLTREQKDYLDVKINLLQNDLNQVQATANAIQKAMLDPNTALDYARAGVTLNDSVPTINAKLAQYAYSKEVANIGNTMSQNGYSTTPITGVQPVQITDSTGTVRNYYKSPSATSTPGQGQYTLGTNEVRFDSSGNVVAVGPSAGVTYNAQGQPVTPTATQTPGSTSSTTSTATDKVLTPTEVATLQKQGVPVVYGMTQSQAAAAAAAAQPKPAPSGYPAVELQPGSTNTAAVTQLQQYLVSQGYMTAADMATGPGIYGPKTTAAVLKMQQALGIDYSSGPGVFGPRTLAALQGKTYTPPKTTTTSSSTTTVKPNWTSTQQNSLIGAGLPSAQVAPLYAAINQYGLQYVLDNSDLTPSIKAALKTIYGQ